MQTRPLGSTGIRVPALGFGCMGLVGWYGTRDDAEARATVLEALDRGISHFDTAGSYQGGDNERFVGECLRARRNEVFLATKFGITRQGGVMRIDNRPAAVKAACEESLARLGVEHIDLFYLHRIDRSVPIEDSVGALAELVTSGKIRFAGLSECAPSTVRRACAVHPIAAVQYEYSMWTRDVERGLLATCRELGVALVAYSPLGRGFLAGNFRDLRELPADDNRQAQPRFQPQNLAHNQRIADAVREFAQRKNCTPAQLALAWLLAQGEDILPIAGMKQRAHLAENLGALSVTLSPVELTQLRAALDRLAVHGERYPPAMMQALEH
jgi:aryl-alcohol dehydrogenase-like predicted oxidoreductase